MRRLMLGVTLVAGLWSGAVQSQQAVHLVSLERVPEGLRVLGPSGGEVGLLSCRGATLIMRRGKTTAASPGPLRVLLTGPNISFGPVTWPLAPDEARFTCTPASPRPDVQVGADVTLRWR